MINLSAMSRTSLAFRLTLGCLIVSTFALCWEATPFFAGLIGTAIVLWPLALNLLLLRFLTTPGGRKIITITTLLYTTWFALVYAEVFYLHPDPQGAIAFIFVSPLALPVLVPMWIIAFFRRG